MGFAAFEGVNLAIRTVSVLKARAVSEDFVPPEPPQTTVILPTLNEELSVEETLKTLMQQSVIQHHPEKIEVLLVDSESTDDTVAIAEPYVDRVITAPRGKLNALTLGAGRGSGDIIVHTDADTTYSTHWLYHHLKHYRNADIAGVTGVNYMEWYSPRTLIEGYVNALRPMTSHFSGKNCSYRKEAFENIGGFDLDVDQFNLKEIWREEEFLFPKRLQTQGKVIQDWSALAHSSSRRLWCDMGFHTKYCEEVHNKERFGSMVDILDIWDMVLDIAESEEYSRDEKLDYIKRARSIMERA